MFQINMFEELSCLLCGEEEENKKALVSTVGSADFRQSNYEL